MSGFDGLTFQEYVEADDMVITTEERPLKQLVEDASSLALTESDNKSDEEEAEDFIPNKAEVLNSISIIRKFLYAKADLPETILRSINSVEKTVLQAENPQQTVLTDFFKSS